MTASEAQAVIITHLRLGINVRITKAEPSKASRRQGLGPICEDLFTFAFGDNAVTMTRKDATPIVLAIVDAHLTRRANTYGTIDDIQKYAHLCRETSNGQ